MATTGTVTSEQRSKMFPDIFYEEPEPEDRLQQFPFMWKVIDALYHRYKDNPDVFATGGGFILYNPVNGNQRVAPDFVIEVASESAASNDMGHKRDLYARLGIAEYWRFDGTGGDYYGQPMTGERLVDGEYQPYEIQTGDDGSITGYSELLDVHFYWNGGVFDVLDPITGKSIDRGDVEREARLAAEAQSEARERELLEEIARLRSQQS